MRRALPPTPMPHSPAEPEPREASNSDLKLKSGCAIAAAPPQAAPPDQIGGGSGGSGGGGSPAATPASEQRDAALRQQLQLAALLLERGRHADALSALQPLLAQQPGSPDLLCLQGRCHAAAGSRPQVRKQGGPPRCLLLLLICTVSPGCSVQQKLTLPVWPTQALAAFAAALAADAACVPALLGCAAVYKDSGLLPDALASLEKALAAVEPADQAAAAAGPAVADSPAAAGVPCDAASVRHALAVVLTDLGGLATTLLLSGVCGSKSAPLRMHVHTHAAHAAAATAQRAPHPLAAHTQARSARWRGRRAGSSSTFAQWRCAQATPPPTTTSVRRRCCFVVATGARLLGLAGRALHSTYACCAVKGCASCALIAAIRCLRAAGVAAGEAGQAAKAIEHYSTAVSRDALPMRCGTCGCFKAHAAMLALHAPTSGPHCWTRCRTGQAHAAVCRGLVQHGRAAQAAGELCACWVPGVWGMAGARSATFHRVPRLPGAPMHGWCGLHLVNNVGCQQNACAGQPGAGDCCLRASPGGGPQPGSGAAKHGGSAYRVGHAPQGSRCGARLRR